MELYDWDEQIAWRFDEGRPAGARTIPPQRSNQSGSLISSSFDSFIPASLVIAARREEIEDLTTVGVGRRPGRHGR